MLDPGITPEWNRTFIQHALNPACSSQLHLIFLYCVTITVSFSDLFAFCLLFFSSLALILPSTCVAGVRFCTEALSRHITSYSSETSRMGYGGKV